MTPAPWLSEDGPDRDVALSTRARLARNLPDFPFPHRANQDQRRLVAQRIRQAAKVAELSHLEPYNLWPLGSEKVDRKREWLRKQVAAQRISPRMMDLLPERWALLDRTGALSLLINEEDHLRIQAFGAGCAPDAVYATAAQAEAALRKGLTFAQEPHLGFLTTSLANVGTGLRLSVLLHLPLLRLMGKLPPLFQAVVDLGGTVRGVRGEGSANHGALYQVSHEATYRPELNPLIFVRSVAGAAAILIDAERAERTRLTQDLTEAQTQTQAAILSAEAQEAGEALELLSALRLYGFVGLAPRVPNAAFAKAVVQLQASEGNRAGYERANLLRRLQRQEY